MPSKPKKTINPQKECLNGNIVVRGARVNNLKNINITIPRNKFVVITGISGSGKSSLAFDTIYAEGQRRYVESLSSYARQFLGSHDKPDVDQITGLSPAIAIDQRTVSHNPRSTVGTVTEIYDLLRLLFARIGQPHCPECGKEIVKQNREEIINKVLNLGQGKEIEILAPVIREKRGEHKKVLQEISKAGFSQVRLDKEFYPIEEAIDLDLDRTKTHDLDVIVGSLKIPASSEVLKKISENKKELVGVTGQKMDRLPEDEDSATEFLKNIDTALDLGDGIIIARELEQEKEHLFSQHFSCPKCGIDLPAIDSRLFSFNSPHGACSECSGLGISQEMDPELVIPNKKLTIAQGAIRPWMKIGSRNNFQLMESLNNLATKHGFSINTPVKDLTKNQIDIVMYGIKVPARPAVLRDEGGFEGRFKGVIPVLMQKYKETNSDYIKTEIEKYMRSFPCSECDAKRLNPVALAVKVVKKNIAELVVLTIEEAIKFFNKLEKNKYTIKLNEKEYLIAEQILKEICVRLKFLSDVGLDYLSLDRSATTLSGGEAQRVRLATQIGAGLTGVVYVLDEPSIGLHQKDNKKLIETLKNLRDLDNSVLVVEHDEQTIMAADHLIDIGPGAGKYGGEIVAQGTPNEVKKNKDSITGQYLSNKVETRHALSLQPGHKKAKRGNGKSLIIKKANEFNLKNIDVKIPLGKFVCITGVSGSGKSTLMTQILAKALARKFYGAKDLPGKHKEITGLNNIDKVISIDQSPIGRTPRSNPATYTGLFTLIRDLFADTKEAKIRQFEPGHFSFNVKGGRCEACQGGGLIKIEMNFLPNVYVPCDECHGKRFRPEVLEVHYKNKNIADILQMSVTEAKDFFEHIPNVYNKLQILDEVGLGYIQLGQSATTLSGGEAQRVKLATELSRRATGKTLYILDEPTTGLHFQDVEKLLLVLSKLVDKGNSILIIEHNLDVIKNVDWIIDLGPEGGDKGGYLVAAGTPADVAKVKSSYTGQFLKKIKI